MNQTTSNSAEYRTPANDKLAVLWHDYHSKLHGFIRSRVESMDAADDILQDVFIKIQKNIGNLQDAERLESWIYQIVRNAVIDHYKARKKYEDLPETLTAPELGDEEQARREISSCMESMIEALPSTYRDAVRLSEIDGLKQ